MQNLFNETTRLSLADSKTISQKIAKTVTEVGELAKVGLTLECASGSRHNIATSDMLLEESCDVMLCAVSIPLSMGYGMDDILDMLHRKVAHWSKQTARASTDNLPYELHVSVDPRDAVLARAACNDYGVKLTTLVLNPGEDIFDAMTSSVHYGSNHTAMCELGNTATFLRGAGVRVVREKIETVPWHPLAPETTQMPAGCYYEAHIPVELTGHCEEAYCGNRDRLLRVAGVHSAKISYNTEKIKSEHHQIVMVTLRTHVLGRGLFTENVDRLVAELTEHHFHCGSVNIEFAIHDTNPQHDYKW